MGHLSHLVQPASVKEPDWPIHTWFPWLPPSLIRWFCCFCGLKSLQLWPRVWLRAESEYMYKTEVKYNWTLERLWSRKDVTVEAEQTRNHPES